MKTLFNKRRFLAVLTAALLISAALITGCTNQFDEQNKPDDNVIIPEGKGLVRLNLADNSARTILPSSPLPLVTSMYYDIEFTARTNPGTNSKSLSRESSTDAQKPIVLAVGTYDVTITAWNASTGGKALAGWKSPTEGIVVASGVSTPVSANLLGWTKDGDGIFTYTITVPAFPAAPLLTWIGSSYYACKIEIYDDNDDLVDVDIDDSPIPTSLTAGGATTRSIKLPAGYYTVVITLSVFNCQDRIITNVLHVYNTMTSSYTYSVPAVNQNIFTVRFSLNGQMADDPDSEFSIGPTLNKIEQLIENIGKPTDPGLPKSTTHTFGGWFRNAGGTGTAWDFANDLVFQDTILYAKWTEKGTEGATITITFTVSDASIASSKVPTDYTGPITYDAINDGDVALVYTLQGGTFTNIKWDLDGIAIAGATGNILTIDDDFPGLDRLVSGTHYLNVKGQRNGQPYNAYVEFTIVITP